MLLSMYIRFPTLKMTKKAKQTLEVRKVKVFSNHDRGMIYTWHANMKNAHARKEVLVEI